MKDNEMLPAVVSIAISGRRGIKKTPVKLAKFKKDFGIEGDAHAGVNDRQVSILDYSSFEKMKKSGFNANFGNFAENVVTEHFDISNIKIGSRISIGRNVVLEVVQIGKNCHGECEIFKQVGDCIMPREGIFAKVLEGGEAKIGDSINLINDKENNEIQSCCFNNK